MEWDVDEPRNTRNTRNDIVCFREGEVPPEPQTWIAMDVLFQPQLDMDYHGWNRDLHEPRKTRNENAYFREGEVPPEPQTWLALDVFFNHG